MEWKERMETLLKPLTSPSKEELRRVLQELNTTVKDVEAELGDPDGKPYYRKLLFHNKEVELLVMNWSDLECSPHNHGNSYGWIHVLNGKTEHTVYEVQDGKVPRAIFEEQRGAGEFLYAPVKGVHRMKDDQKSGLITLHLYAPPIKDMVVYDLKACAACVVSEDCGAWWPEETRQRVKELKLKA
ncbi:MULTISPECIES: cysteine dioxygenase [Pontibacillus]|uniref:Cysteine dioxygenase family protein n=1 Tax=Pontibacillus chungwhensis TaxID=265426 RepID=A0ABY8UVW4_9BACI|nr:MULTISPECIES: cysteine dioxygenase family protein [Pontibacillus]MCD5323178.1 cysteine dioxygenase family protein [Pontibacillus sp. HN14]WIF96565.1 cysteine dioxygenase family protein [Pontibacillus chungwhensis]